MNKLLVKAIYTRDREEEEIRALASGRLEPVFYSEDWTQEYYREQLAEAEVIYGEPDAEDLVYCRRLRLMQITWSGIDYYNNAGTFPKGAVLCNCTGEYGQTISDYAMAMIHGLCFTLPHYVRNMDKREWHMDGGNKSLEGGTALIVGAGDIGSSVARKLRPSVGRIIGVRRSAGALGGCFDQTATMGELKTLLPEADVVVLSLPDTRETAKLFDERTLRLMKDDAVLVNVGRGTVLDFDALARVMSEGKLWGVGVDVSDPEPFPPEHPLWAQERFMITPHISGNAYTCDSGTDRRIKARCMRNIANYLEGRPLENVTSFATGYRSRD